MTIRSRHPTVEEFLAWPEEKPYLELINGEVKPKAMPDYPHACLQTEFVLALGQWAKSRGGGYTLTEQRTVLDVEGKQQVVLPDVAWWSPASLPVPRVGAQVVPPTLAVEILSPNDTYAEVEQKVRHYKAGGVALVWVVDATARKVTVHRATGLPDFVDDTLSDVLLPGLEIALSSVFAALSPEPPPRTQE